MNEFTKSLIEKEMEKLAERLGKLEQGSDDYAAALADMTTLSNLINADRKSRGEFALASVEVSKEEFNESHETKKLELEKDKLKHEGKKLITDGVATGVKAGVAFGATALAVYADQKGLFVSKHGISVAPDIKI